MGRAQVGDTLQRILVFEGGTRSSTTLTAILYCFKPQLKLTLPTGYDPCVHPTSPLARRGAYASDCTEGVTKSERIGGTNGDCRNRVDNGNNVEIGNGDGDEGASIQNKDGDRFGNGDCSGNG